MRAEDLPLLLEKTEEIMQNEYNKITAECKAKVLRETST